MIFPNCAAALHQLRYHFPPTSGATHLHRIDNPHVLTHKFRNAGVCKRRPSGQAIRWERFAPQGVGLPILDA